MENSGQGFRVQCDLISKKYDETCAKFAKECIEELGNEVPADKKEILIKLTFEFLKQHFYVWNDSFLQLLREKKKRVIIEKIIFIMNYCYDAYALCLTELIPLKSETVQKLMTALQVRENKFKALFGQWWNIADNIIFNAPGTPEETARDNKEESWEE